MDNVSASPSTTSGAPLESDARIAAPLSRMPSVFVSHGAPTLLLEDGPARQYLQSLGASLGRPRAILAVSAHWETAVPTVMTTVLPRTIHDFGAFDSALHRFRYPAPGAPHLALRVDSLLTAAGIPVALNAERGFDHGAWVPLALMYPDASVPVAQLSIQTQRGAAFAMQVGEALAPLAGEEVLILATGSLTHNLRAIEWTAGPDSGVTPPWVTAFTDWIASRIADDDRPALLAWESLAPFARQNHPTPEHLLPLFTAIGAGGRGTRRHASYTYGVIAMDAYTFT